MKNMKMIFGLTLILFFGSNIGFALEPAKVTVTIKQDQQVSFDKNQGKTNFEIKGKIIDAATKKGINGAQISCSAFSDAIASETGEFVIKVFSKNASINITAWGYMDKVVALKGNNAVVISLISDCFSSAFEDKYLPTGESAGFNFPFASVQTKKVSAQSNVLLEELLQTKAGEIRSVKRSGSPGIGSNVFIRGYNSLNGRCQPLIVVDGIPYEDFLNRNSLIEGFYSNAMTNINMDEIENISIIKDGYSTYGVKGANGVIAITTKRGRELKSRIEASASWGVINTPRLLPIMDGDAYRIYFTEVLNGMKGVTNNSMKSLQMLDDNKLKPYYAANHNNTNWQDQIYTDGMVQNYHAQVTGGTETARFGIFLGYLDNQSYLKNTGMDRFSYRLNSDFQLSEKVKIAVSVAYTNTNYDLRNDGVNATSSPTYVSLIKSPLFSPNQYDNLGQKLVTYSDLDELGISNPSLLIRTSTGTNEENRFNLYGKVSIELTKNTYLKGIFSYDKDEIVEKFVLPDFGASTDFSDVTGTNIGYKSTVKDRDAHYVGVYSDISVNYSKKGDYKHHLNANLGLRYQTNIYENISGEGHNLSDDKYIYLNNSLVGRSISGGNGEWKWLSMYSSVNYDFMKRYLLSANMSVDGSSRVGSNVNAGLFPSVAGAWVISSEKFMKSAKDVDLLRLRSSFGLSGNDDIGDFTAKQYFGATRYMDKIGLSAQNLANKDLKWETTQKVNVGLDLAILNERVLLKTDFYLNKTKDLVTLQNLLPYAGMRTAYMNGGNLTNKGYEISLDFRLIDLKNFKWRANAVFSKYKNELTALPNHNADVLNNIYGAQILSRVGQPIGLFYGYKTDGIISGSDDPATNLKVRTSEVSSLNFTAGDVRFVEVVKDNILDQRDLQVIGNPNPDFYGAFGTGITIKNVSLDALFTYSYGNDIYNYLRSELESMYSIQNQSTAVLNRWKAEGQQTNVPKATYGDPMGNSRFSDRWIEDGSYVRLKTLTLTWNVPKRLLFSDGVTFFASANNVFLFTNYLGRDPESSSSNQSLYQGIDAGLMPQSRSFIAGLKINL